MRIIAAHICTCLCLGSLAIAQPAPQSVYAPPELPSESDGTNQGAVNLDFSAGYFSNYVFRGIEVFKDPEDSEGLNLQFDGKLAFNLGKLPHPFVNLFANIKENDPVSRFQEIRPTLGFDWTIKPLVISAGHTSYIYPDRDESNTSEVFLQIALDENVLFGGNAVPTPYAMAAYDYDLYDGIYFEAGLKYKLAFDEIGLTMRFSGAVSYLNGIEAQIPDDEGNLFPGIFTNERTEDVSINGLQRWQVGVVADYSLNHLFDVSNRFGEWHIRGYLYYTDDLDDTIRTDSQLWGGAGISFSY
ncbi:MAG: hypothetical protein H7144_10995 [Burkholderiales bacterium]|nr:hypothetical protein [Phycisphaerae bacterium]